MKRQSDPDQLQLWDFEPADQKSRRKGDLYQANNQRFEQTSLFGEIEPVESAPTLQKVLNNDFADRRPLSILVADDNEINRKVIRVILEKLGYQCVEAKNGEEALSQYNAGNFDYIFMDLDMPEMDGVEATKRIRSIEDLKKREREVAEIIAVTANVSNETRLSCRRAGMNGYLEKPITASMIKEQLLRSWPRIRARRAKKDEIGL
ncbi:MAG: response regulator [Verrucomicrobiota bacterium]